MSKETDRLAAIAGPHATVADKIRALSAAGVARADIARFLGKRYQHVRNVLEDDAQRGGGYVLGRVDLSGLREPPPGVEDAGAEPYVVDVGVAILRLPVREDGAVALPAMAMQALGLRPGGVAIGELEGDRLTIFSVRESVRRIQAMTRELVPGDHSLADGLIAERREEAARESAGREGSGRTTGAPEDG
jgi:hypothetical protein